MTDRRTGRPQTTTHEEVAAVALRLFAERGFEETTADDIARTVGVGRRTLFRYYPSKNDIVWGAFDEQLSRLREQLAGSDPDAPLMEVLRKAIVAFNDYGDDQLPELRTRMTLITGVPALQGHAMLRYADWCAVIAEFVAARRGLPPDALLPQVVANAALGTAMATYRHWIEHPEVDLLAALDRAFAMLAAGFQE